MIHGANGCPISGAKFDQLELSGKYANTSTDPSFGLKRPCFEGLTCKNRGHLGSRCIWLIVFIYLYYDKNSKFPLFQPSFVPTVRHPVVFRILGPLCNPNNRQFAREKLEATGDQRSEFVGRHQQSQVSLVEKWSMV